MAIQVQKATEKIEDLKRTKTMAVLLIRLPMFLLVQHHKSHRLKKSANVKRSKMIKNIKKKKKSSKKKKGEIIKKRNQKDNNKGRKVPLWILNRVTTHLFNNSKTYHNRNRDR